MGCPNFLQRGSPLVKTFDEDRSLNYFDNIDEQFHEHFVATAYF